MPSYDRLPPSRKQSGPIMILITGWFTVPCSHVVTASVISLAARQPPSPHSLLFPIS